MLTLVGKDRKTQYPCFFDQALDSINFLLIHLRNDDLDLRLPIGTNLNFLSTAWIDTTSERFE